MAVGSTELVNGFDLHDNRPQAPKILSAAVCGACGALIAPGFEAQHMAFENAAWSTTALTARVARSPYEANNP